MAEVAPRLRPPSFSSAKRVPQVSFPALKATCNANEWRCRDSHALPGSCFAARTGQMATEEEEEGGDSTERGGKEGRPIITEGRAQQLGGFGLAGGWSKFAESLMQFILLRRRRPAQYSITWPSAIHPTVRERCNGLVLIQPCALTPPPCSWLSFGWRRLLWLMRRQTPIKSDDAISPLLPWLSFPFPGHKDDIMHGTHTHTSRAITDVFDPPASQRESEALTHLPAHLEQPC